jgi:hypothetical protein
VPFFRALRFFPCQCYSTNTLSESLEAEVNAGLPGGQTAETFKISKNNALLGENWKNSRPNITFFFRKVILRDKTILRGASSLNRFAHGTYAILSLFQFVSF